MMPSPTRDLGADALGRVAVARDRVEPPALLVEQQQQRVLVAEQLGEPVDAWCVDDRVEVGAAAQPRRELAERSGEPAGAGPAGRVRPDAPADVCSIVDDAVDVGARAA